MSSYKNLVPLSSIAPETKMWVGSIFREYNVSRIDVKNKEQDDYYDLMLVDLTILIDNTFALINVTLENDNRGRIAAVLSDIESRYFLLARDLQSFFSDNEIFYLEQNKNNNK
jgi:hypothetical protein